MKIKVTFEVPERYKKIGAEILNEHQLIWAPSNEKADILLISNDDYEYDPQIKMIQTISAGVDHLNLNRIGKSTIICSNAGAYAISVAEHFFALVLTVSKKIIEKSAEMKVGIFKQEPTFLMYNKKIGIIGYGTTGKRIAKLAKAFGMHVIAIGRRGKDENVDEFMQLDGIQSLLSHSDVIVLTIPLTKHTENLIGEKELEHMKKNAMLVNLARPEIVDKAALFRHLRQNENFWFLSDVWWDEPEVQDTNLVNVILTPHIAGGRSGKIMEQAYIHAFENIKKFAEGKVPDNVVKVEEYVPRNTKFYGV